MYERTSDVAMSYDDMIHITGEVLNLLQISFESSLSLLESLNAAPPPLELFSVCVINV